MKKLALLAAFLFFTGIFLYVTEGKAQMGPGMMGPGYGYGYGMGPGMMGQGMRGWGMGPGRMGQGYGRPYGPRFQQRQKPLDKEEARQEVENYLKSMGNPNLKLGEISDKGSYFEADIVTKDNSLVKINPY